MSLKSHLKDWLPPIMVRGLQTARRRWTNGQPAQPVELPEWEYAPQGWRTQGLAVGGWNQPGVAETYARKWQRFSSRLAGTAPLGINHEVEEPHNDCFSTHNQVMTLAYVVGRAARQRDRLSILDYGGALGHHRAFLQALYPDLILDYSCCELPHVCAQGRSLHPGVKFVADDAWTTETFDLVIASGSLHYFENWHETFAQLARAARSSVLITRLPAAQRAPSFVVLQRAWRYGYRTEYLGWCLNQTEFLGAAQRNRLVLKREFLVYIADARVPNAPEQPCSKGFLFDKEPAR